MHRAVDIIYRVLVDCADTGEAHVRAALLEAVAERPLILRQLRTEDTDEPHTVRLHAEIESPAREQALIEQIVAHLRRDPAVTAIEFGEGTTEVE